LIQDSSHTFLNILRPFINHSSLRFPHYSSHLLLTTLHTLYSSLPRYLTSLLTHLSRDSLHTSSSNPYSCYSSFLLLLTPHCSQPLLITLYAYTSHALNHYSSIYHAYSSLFSTSTHHAYTPHCSQPLLINTPHCSQLLLITHYANTSHCS
jgi:hypothetical protein